MNLYDEGSLVGELQIWRKDRWENKQYHCPMIQVELERKAVRGIKEENLSSAELCLAKNENRVREKMIAAKKPSEDQIVYWLQEILYENGFRKTKPRMKAAC